MALKINTNIKNDVDEYLLDARAVKGGYVVVTGESTDTKENLPAATLVEGTLVYDAKEKKSYRYTNNAWVEETTGSANKIVSPKGFVQLQGEELNEYSDAIVISPTGTGTGTAGLQTSLVVRNLDNSSSVHIYPDSLGICGTEIVNYTAEEVYDLLPVTSEEEAEKYAGTYEVGSNALIFVTQNGARPMGITLDELDAGEALPHEFAYTEDFEANPTEDATETLDKLKIKDTVYELSGGSSNCGLSIVDGLICCTFEEETTEEGGTN